jgi:Fe2+ or Zn2+ uptake regulation protein
MKNKKSSKKQRMTTQRRLVLDYLHSVVSHPTAAEIFKEIKEKAPATSFSTVYRNLEYLKNKNLIMELSYANAANHYDGNPKPHYHFVCQKCWKISDINLPVLEEINSLAQKQVNGAVQGHRLEFFGYCASCKNKKLRRQTTTRR